MFRIKEEVIPVEKNELWTDLKMARTMKHHGTGNEDKGGAGKRALTAEDDGDGADESYSQNEKQHHPYPLRYSELEKKSPMKMKISLDCLCICKFYIILLDCSCVLLLLGSPSIFLRLFRYYLFTPFFVQRPVSLVLSVPEQ